MLSNTVVEAKRLLLVCVWWNACIYEGINYEVLFRLIVKEKKENRDDIVEHLEYCEVECRDYLKAVVELNSMTHKSGTKMHGFILIVGFSCCGLF